MNTDEKIAVGITLIVVWVAVLLTHMRIAATERNVQALQQAATTQPAEAGKERR